MSDAENKMAPRDWYLYKSIGEDRAKAKILQLRYGENSKQEFSTKTRKDTHDSRRGG